MALFAYDAAYPAVDAIIAKRPDLVCCYIDGPHGYPLATVQKFLAAGIPVLPNHERMADQLLGGAAAGRQAASDAVAGVLAWGLPADGTVAICYSVDVRVDPAHYSPILAAFDAINTVHAGRFKASLYGQGALIDYLRANGKTQAKGWLSASSSYPGFNPASPNVGAVQRVGSDVPSTDRSDVTDLAGLCPWYPAGYTPAGGGTNLEEWLMALTDAEQRRVLAAADLFTYLSPELHVAAMSTPEVLARVQATQAAVSAGPGVPVNVQPLLDAIHALPAGVVAAIKEAL